VYAPVVVPPPPTGIVTDPPLPQPALNPTATISTNAASNVDIRRRRVGTIRTSNPASATPPPIGSNRILGFSIAAATAVVLTVSVAVPAVVPLIAIGEVTEHVGVSVPLVGETAQLKATLPVNPPPGVTVIVDVFPLVAPGEAIVIAPLFVSVTVSVADTAVTITPTVVVAVRLPDVPVTVTT
jgi:hypothetical protein